MKTTKGLCFAAAIALLLSTAGTVIAQEETGNVYVKVLDTSGNPLPGVTVELAGMGAPRIMVTNTVGEARFLGLDPGSFYLKATLEGFSTLEYPNVVVRLARSTSLEIQLTEAIGEVITVTSESPLLDERQLATGTTVSQIELETIPTARDPWSVIHQTPEVNVDRINVGGNQSGQQSNFRAPTTDRFENDFMVDGIQITDMAATGGSPMYYDFDQFSEMQFSTGGNDITKVVSGVAVNLVTKRGTNEFRGSARYFLTDANGYFGFLEAGESNIQDKLAPGQEDIPGNKIDEIQDYGFEAGGPVVRDRAWLWASWGQNDIRQFAAGGVPDNTRLQNTAIKFNTQIASPNSLVASFNNGEKIKQGRDASPERPQETTFNQRGPTALYKVEDTHVFGSNLFLSGSWTKVDGGFQLVSQGQVNAGCAGTTCPLEIETLLDPDGIYRNSYGEYNAPRPDQQVRLEGSYFFNTGNATSHEMKFGGRYRLYEASSTWIWPGRNILHNSGPTWGLEIDEGVLLAYRGQGPPIELYYNSLWVQDTISLNRWTFNAGLRWDVSDGKNLAYTVDANPAFPEMLPAVEFGGNDGGGVEFNTILPRLGVTYALGQERKTLLRGSFSQYAQQLDTGIIETMNPLGYAVAFLQYEDLNGNYMWDDRSEPTEFLFPSGYDPDDPGAAVSPNQTDPGLDPALTDELILGAEHSILPELVVGGSLNWRRTRDLIDERRLVRGLDGVVRPETFDDYFRVGTFDTELPDGTMVTTEEWNLRPDLEPSGGELQINGGRERSYQGMALNFTKRLSNQWMARGYVTYNFSEDWSVPADYLDDTNGPNPTQEKDDCDGCLFAAPAGTTSGNVGDVMMQNTWAWNLNGMYQIAPDRAWGFNVAANLFGREGYPLPYYSSLSGTIDGITRDISVVGNTDDFRVEDILTVDIRLEKEFAATSGVGLTFSIDGFNIFNEAYVLQRERNLGISRGNYLDESLAPRIWRLGVRINWR